MAIAHQAGASWDEALFVVIPVALFTVLLFFANRQAVKRHDQGDTSDDRKSDSTEQ
jgi:hypothetical protein